MAAPVIVNEVLYFSRFYLQRVSKDELCKSLASFYHEEELYAAKIQLCEVAAAVSSPIDGWSKFVNSKGAPIAHRKSDGAARRVMDGDDVVTMLMVLDVNNVPMPTYASIDPSRIPPPLVPNFVDASEDNNTLLELTKSLEAVIKRLDKLEVPHPPSVRQPTTGMMSTYPAVVSSDPKLSAVTSASPPVPLSGPLPAPSPTDLSWANVAVNGDVQALQTIVMNKNKSVRVGTATNSKLKAVPRQLACFVGRLDADTTEEDLSAHLTAHGMKGVVCRKLVAKDGRRFKTAAFKVTCCTESRELFYNEASWPSGAELRDWVYRNTNGGQ